MLVNNKMVVGLYAGCLLRSLPGDVIFDNSSGFSFTCDLSDNIAAPWTSLSLCAPGMFFGESYCLHHCILFLSSMLILQNTVCICLTLVPKFFWQRCHYQLSQHHKR